MSTVLTNFETWKHFLGDRIEQAKKIGMSEETIASLAVEIGNFLDEKVDPKNDQERVLKLEINQTKAMISSHLRELQDSAYDMISYDFNGVLTGKDRTADELLAQVQAVTAADIVKVAESVKLDTVYFLRDRKEA